MFEIGPALREARERQQLSYSQIEEGTKIRSRYIRALEEEDFAVLPGPTYTKGFLRAYADYLGLDGHLFIDEFNSRHHDPRVEPDREIYPRSKGRQQHRRRRESGIVMIALAAIVLIVSLVFIAAKNSNDTAPLPLPPATNPSTGSTGGSSDGGGSSQPESGQSTGTQTTQHKKKAAVPKKFTVVISASGDSYVTTHVGSMTGAPAVTEKGTTLDNYLLQAGVDATIKSGKPVYVAFGAPGNISGITINGKTAHMPYIGSAQAMKITATGITAA
jgi:cytoskeletal protein RodZ